MTITYDDFLKVDIRVGKIIRTEEFPEARNPAYKLWIDFGDLGIKKTSAQITALYQRQDLVGRNVIAVVNFPPKQIGPFISEVLVLGVVHGSGKVTLIGPDGDVPLGQRIL